MNPFKGNKRRKARQIVLPLTSDASGKIAGNCDSVLLMAVLALLCMGIIMVYSASALMAWERFHDPFLFLKRKLYFTLLGLLLMFALMRMDYRRLLKLTKPLMVLTALMLIAVFIPGIGIERGGARRWIHLGGMTFQPSEMAKLALIFYFSRILAKKQERIRDFAMGYLPMLLVLAFFCMLIILERDAGTPILIAGVVIIMFFVGGVPLRFILGTVVASLPLIYMVSTTGYRAKRVFVFLHPWDDPLGAGFQTIQSFLALGRGGLFGLGLGDGKQKLFYLPEPHTDFIFSVIGEELGLMGTMTVIFLFFLLIWRGVRVAKRSPDLEGTNLAFGISILLGIQALMHMFVATGLMPAKGLTLPFVSAGGSSLLVSLMAAGVLLNISRRCGFNHA